MLRTVQTCFEEKVFDVLHNYRDSQKVLLLFNHGLGDFVLFLPLFDELCRSFLRHDIYIGCNPERNFQYLHPKCRIINAPYGKYEGVYDIIFNILYLEPPRNSSELNSFSNRFYVQNIHKISKPYLCNELEIGLPIFVWRPYEFNLELNNKDSKRVGVHFFGHTSVQNKDVSFEVAEKIWNQIKKAGYEPFEIQMLSINAIEEVKIPKFIGENTIRYQFPNLKIMCENILKCRCFLGVDSGPIYLAGSLLGFNRVLGLQRLREFKKVLPEKINILDVEEKFDIKAITDFIKGVRK